MATDTAALDDLIGRRVRLEIRGGLSYPPGFEFDRLGSMTLDAIDRNMLLLRDRWGRPAWFALDAFHCIREATAAADAEAERDREWWAKRAERLAEARSRRWLPEWVGPLAEKITIGVILALAALAAVCMLLLMISGA